MDEREEHIFPMSRLTTNQYLHSGNAENVVQRFEYDSGEETVIHNPASDMNAVFESNIQDAEHNSIMIIPHP